MLGINTDQIFFTNYATLKLINMNEDVLKAIEMIRTSPKTKRQIALDLGVPEQRLYAWINKGSKPGYEDIQKLIKYFGIRPEPKEFEPEIVVLIDRVAEILAKIQGTSVSVERSKVIRDVEQMKALRDSS